MKALFEITKRSRRPNYSMNTPTGADYARGIAFIESLTSPADGPRAAALADATAPIIGFITRKSLITGPILDDAIYPGKIELPFKSGEEASFEDGEEIEAEGGTGSQGTTPASDEFVVVTATGALAANTAIGTELSFAAGKFRAAQSGDLVEFTLIGLPTPVLTGNIRIRARRCHAYKKA